MIQQLIRYSLIALFLILLQVTVVNNIVLFKLLHPYLYLMVLAILPFQMPQWGVLLSCFGIGLLMDLFSFTPGMHASACTAAGFARPFLLTLLRPLQGVGDENAPHMQALGIGNFLLYILGFVLVHQLVLHMVEVFSFHEIGHTLLRVGINTGASWILILVVEMLGFYQKTEES